MGGVCQPVTMASGLPSAVTLAVDSTTLYFATQGSFTSGLDGHAIERMPLAGGVPEVLASGSEVGTVSDIAIDAAFVYSVGAGPDGYGAVTKISVAGGPLTTLAGGIGQADSVVLSGTTLFWNERNDAVVASLSIAGGTPLQIATSPWHVSGIAVDDSYVYFTDDWSYVVQRVPLGGGSVTMLAPGDSPEGVAVDATSVYWADTFSIKKAPKTGLTGGATPTVVVAGQTSVSLITLDGPNLYWSDEGAGTVNMIPIAGGAPRVLATGQILPGKIVVGPTAIYWVNYGSGFLSSDSSIMRVAKP
jgi:hypothetical protein